MNRLVSFFKPTFFTILIFIILCILANYVNIFSLGMMFSCALSLGCSSSIFITLANIFTFIFLPVYISVGRINETAGVIGNTALLYVYACIIFSFMRRFDPQKLKKFLIVILIICFVPMIQSFIAFAINQFKLISAFNMEFKQNSGKSVEQIFILYGFNLQIDSFYAYPAYLGGMDYSVGYSLLDSGSPIASVQVKERPDRDKTIKEMMSLLNLFNDPAKKTKIGKDIVYVVKEGQFGDRYVWVSGNYVVYVSGNKVKTDMSRIFTAYLRKYPSTLKDDEVVDVYQPVIATPTPKPTAMPVSCSMTGFQHGGCGSCPNVQPVIECLYRNKGDDMCKVYAELNKKYSDEVCKGMGCTVPVLYKYCD